MLNPLAEKLGVLPEGPPERPAATDILGAENPNDPNGWNMAGAVASTFGPSPATAITDFTGDKFPGGFGLTRILCKDYWTLRNRSAQLFTENLYARGIIRRLITNEINTGLSPEVTPDEPLLGLEEESLNEWSDDVESRFAVWGRFERACDHKERDKFAALQRAARLEALVGGDVLVVLRTSKRYKTQRVQLITGAAVQNPMGRSKADNGNRIVHGVELDKEGRHVAFYVRQIDGTTKRVAAVGERSGRRLAWLVYGTDKRYEEVRGEPLLSLILQSLAEVDRYRDSVQRKAVLNSMLAMFLKKDADKMSTKPFSGGAVRKGQAAVTDGGGTQRTINIQEHIPGLILQELQVGEEPHGFDNRGVDEKYGDFESAIMQAVGWALEMPPEILQLAFSSNYSASQAAINEFKAYLDRVRSEFGANFCQPVYKEWLLNEVLLGNISAPGLLDAWRDPLRYTQLGAWLLSDWSGAIKPSTDMKKLAQGYEIQVANGWISNTRVAKEISGTKFANNVKKIKRENEQLAEAKRVSLELEQEFATPTDPAAEPPGPGQDSLEARVEELEGEVEGIREITAEAG